ncbi:MAG: hypothetical protein IPG53_01630 [Ignavibacteriales bacterium]|nr:hypothetical protein [Ignavibacteriales bacterium]
MFLRNGTLKYIQKKSNSSYNVGDFAAGLITINGNYLDAVMMQSPVGYSLLVLEEGNKIRQFPEPVETTQKTGYISNNPFRLCDIEGSITDNFNLSFRQ